ncbi:MAG: hypothetical protein C4323_14560 [Mastigocladus sp. ERB_26_2]
MLAIYTREELTSNKPDKSNLDFLTRDLISSLLFPSEKRHNLIDIQLDRKNSTDVRYRLPLQYLELIKVVDNLQKESSESNLQITQSRLIELLQEDNEDDEGFLKPTPYAFDKAWKLVNNASQFMRNCFPKAWVSTNDEGGIRLTWSRLEKEAEVRLICGSEPNKPTYLYHEKGEKYGVVNDVSGLSLAGWLQWLDKV